MYTVICDNCGKDSNEGSEYSAWSDPDQAETMADSCDFLKIDIIEKRYEVIKQIRDNLPDWIEVTLPYYSQWHHSMRRVVEIPATKHYCPYCVSYDNEDNLVLKNIKP